MSTVFSPESPKPAAAKTSRFDLGFALDVVLLVCAIGVVVLANTVGLDLLAHGVHIFLAWPPLLAGWAPHVGQGTAPAILLAVLVVARGPALAARLRWRTLLWSSWLVAAAWTLSLALVDGWQAGVAGRLTTSNEYLNDVHRVQGIGQMLRDFTAHILYTSPYPWSMHVGAHPPGVFLIYVLLDKIGLSGGGFAGMVTILIGSSAAVAVAATLRALGKESLARTVLPFGVLFPGAVWVGVSADGMFAGILAWGVALVAIGCTGRIIFALFGGILLGYTVFLSYGLALAGLIPLVVFAVTRRWAAILAAVIGAGAVVAAFALSGFWWFTGLDLTQIIYTESVAKTRPYNYFIWANLAAFAFAIGPAVLVGLRRLAARPRSLPVVATLLALAAVLAVLAADISGMSKAEVERIWLPFAVWMMIPCALIPQRHIRIWLAAQGILALLVNHFLFTIW